ncbi:MAG: hypothetical protein J5785_01990 [Spirochaetales bacterium]|nr:hypothetical protein [Spirochaetales bacterium]
MDDGLVLAFDLGTSGVKAVLVDFKGRVVDHASESYCLIMPHPGWAEQVPEDYWVACCRASRAVCAAGAGERVRAVVFATQWKGMIPLDAEGNVLHNSLIWMDARTGEEAAELARSYGKPITHLHYWPRVMWFRKHFPELFSKTRAILEANSFLKYRCCGVMATDVSNNFIHSPLPQTDEFFRGAMEAAELDRDLFPPLCMPSDCLGPVTPQAAAELGITTGAKVFGGLCDIPAVAIGSGAISPGDCHMYLGTSGWVAVTESVKDCPPPLMPSLMSAERWVCHGDLRACCFAFEWGIRTFYAEEKSRLGEDIYAFVEKEMDAVPAGSDGLVCIPTLDGVTKMFGTSMNASFVNLRPDHGRAHMLNSLLEGICMIYRSRKETLEQRFDRKFEAINAVGGGALSRHWMQIMADSLGCEIRVPEGTRFAGALGAACAALIGLGVYRDEDECKKAISGLHADVFTPDPEKKAVYDALYERMRRLYGFKAAEQNPQGASSASAPAN